MNFQGQNKETNILKEISDTYMVNFTYAGTDNRFQFDVLVSNKDHKRDQRRRHPTVNAACGEAPVGAWVEAQIKILEEVEQIQDGQSELSHSLRWDFHPTDKTPVQLTLWGPKSVNYTVQWVSLVWRDGNTLNGVDRTHRQITFGGTWNAGVTVPARRTVTSTPIPFDLLAGQDVFVTYWVPSENPTLFRTGGTTTSAWTIAGKDQTATIDWGSLSTTETRTYIYIAESLEVLVQSGGGSPADTTPPPPSSLTIPNPTVAGGQSYVVPASGLQGWNTVYIDRAFTFTTVPSSVQEAAYIQTANQETRTLLFPTRSFPPAAGGNPSVGWSKVGQHGRRIETKNALVPLSLIPASRWRKSIRCLVSGFRSKRWIPATNHGYDDQVKNCIQLILRAPLPPGGEALANRKFSGGLLQLFQMERSRDRKAVYGRPECPDKIIYKNQHERIY